MYCSARARAERPTAYHGSLAGQPYYSYVHACAYDKWAGGNPHGKIRLGTLDRFSCHGNMCGIFLRVINASVEFARAGNFLLF